MLCCIMGSGGEWNHCKLVITHPFTFCWIRKCSFLFIYKEKIQVGISCLLWIHRFFCCFLKWSCQTKYLPQLVENICSITLILRPPLWSSLYIKVVSAGNLSFRESPGMFPTVGQMNNNPVVYNMNAIVTWSTRSLTCDISCKVVSGKHPKR